MSESVIVDLIKVIPRVVVTLWAWVFRFPVIIDYAGQGETEKGYVFAVDLYTETAKVVAIPRANFSIRIILDRQLARRAKKEKLLYGEHVRVFESELLLQAYVNGRSFGNLPPYIPCHREPKRVFLLTCVEGPGTANPSLSLQLGKIYQKVKVRLKKRFFPLTYCEIPIRHLAIVSGNKRTRIIDSD